MQRSIWSSPICSSLLPIASSPPYFLQWRPNQETSAGASLNPDREGSFRLRHNSQTDFTINTLWKKDSACYRCFLMFCSWDTSLDIKVEEDVHLQWTMNICKHQSAKTYVAGPEKYHRYGHFEVCFILHLQISYHAFFCWILTSHEKYFIMVIVKDRLDDEVAKKISKT